MGSFLFLVAVAVATVLLAFGPRRECKDCGTLPAYCPLCAERTWHTEKSSKDKSDGS